MPTLSSNTLMGFTRMQSGVDDGGSLIPAVAGHAIRAPLHAASVAGDVALVRQLLGLTEKKGLVVKIDEVDEVGRTALHVAAELGRRDVCEVPPSILIPHPARASCSTTLEATQGQISSQSPTDATQFWWNSYGS